MGKRCVLVVCLLTALSFISNCGSGGTSGGGNPPPPPPPPAGDFTLIVESATVALQQGGALVFQTVQATPTNGFTGTIQLSLSALPTGVTGTPPAPYSLAINSASPQSASFQLAAAPATGTGASTITVTATSGSISHTATFAVNVTQAAPWTIHASPSSVSLTPGTSATITVSVTSNSPTPPQLETQLPDTNGLYGINITSPQSLLTPSSPVTFIINPTPQAQPVKNYPFILTASDNASNTGIVTLPLTVTVPFSANTTPTRSTFARTDKSPTGMVYDQARKLLFVSVEILNEVVVLSTVDGHQVASIPVNYPSGIDESADGSAVYVVSPYFGGITTIDPNLLQVVGHVNVPAGVSPDSLGAAFFQVATLSNGKVVLLEAGSLTGVLLWTPANNNFAVFGTSDFLLAAGIITRSADHTKVLGFAGYAGSMLYDASTDTFVGPNSTIIGYSAISPSGSQIISVGLQNSPTVFYDANLNPIGTMQLDAFPVTGVVYSLDGRHAYVLTSQNDNGGNIAAVIDTSTFTVTGLVPGFAFDASLPFTGQWITTFADDETGMLFGATDAGVGFLDMTSPTSLGYPLPQSFIVQPTLASLSGPTTAQLNGAGFAQNFTYNLFVGAPPASPQTLMASNVSVQSTSSASVMVPKGAIAGPANVTLTRSDGFFEVMPDGVTFGPTILRVDADAGSSAGGDTIKIYGYGFDAGNPTVTIGGKTAAISRIVEAIQDQIFPTESITLTLPSGPTGSADVVVSTTSGSTTVAAGFQYLKSVQVYPKAGALDAIAYDRSRQRLYVSNEDHGTVEVYDLASNTYLAPIPVGNGPTNLALTPDGSLLAVLDHADGTVSVVDPVAMHVKATYPVLTSSDMSLGCSGLAFGMSPAEPHRMLVDVVCTASGFGGLFHLVNLDTGSLVCTGVAGCTTNGTDINFQTGIAAMASTPDGSKVFLATTTGGGSPQPVGLLDLTANTLTSGFSGDASDAAVNADGTVFAANFEMADSHLNPSALMAFEPYVDAGAGSFNDVIGEKLSPAGSLLFAPQTSGVDIFDVHTGRLVQHVVLPDPIPPDSNAMALDETGTKMFLISNTGVTIAELQQSPLSIATVSPSTGPSGTTVKLHGSGFVTGAVVSFGTTEASTTFVDLNTLQATVPSLSAGPVRITVTNPDGQKYVFDNAFTAN
ncbi:MAG: IPT/TIG domain-containing protein [Candidatus Acidiferrales bacterium]